MKFNNSWWNANIGLFILRFGLGITFFTHGVAKLCNMQGTTSFFQMLGLGTVLPWVVAAIETLGGILLISGIWTTCSSLALAAVMIGVLSTAKWGKPFLGGFELEFTLLFSLLALSAIGAGHHSLFRSGKCKTCEGCDCNCHTGDHRCGLNGKCMGCGCA